MITLYRFRDIDSRRLFRDCNIYEIENVMNCFSRDFCVKCVSLCDSSQFLFHSSKAFNASMIIRISLHWLCNLAMFASVFIVLIDALPHCPDHLVITTVKLRAWSLSSALMGGIGCRAAAQCGAHDHCCTKRLTCLMWLMMALPSWSFLMIAIIAIIASAAGQWGHYSSYWVVLLLLL